MTTYQCIICGEMDSEVEHGICKGCQVEIVEHGCPDCGSMTPAQVHKGYPGEVFYVCPDCGHEEYSGAEEVFEWMV